MPDAKQTVLEPVPEETPPRFEVPVSIEFSEFPESEDEIRDIAAQIVDLLRSRPELPPVSGEEADDLRREVEEEMLRAFAPDREKTAILNAAFEPVRRTVKSWRDLRISDHHAG